PNKLPSLHLSGKRSNSALPHQDSYNTPHDRSLAGRGGVRVPLARQSGGNRARPATSPSAQPSPISAGRRWGGLHGRWVPYLALFLPSSSPAGGAGPRDGSSSGSRKSNALASQNGYSQQAS